MMSQEPQTALLQAAASGDRRAQLALYQLCYPVLISTARRYYYNSDEQMQFSITPVFRYSLGNIIEHVDIKNRYQSVGLLTGFSFSF
jgi:hypothetical protein